MCWIVNTSLDLCIDDQIQISYPTLVYFEPDGSLCSVIFFRLASGFNSHLFRKGKKEHSCEKFVVLVERVIVYMTNQFVKNYCLDNFLQCLSFLGILVAAYWLLHDVCVGFQESYIYKDPITEFLECLYVNFDFDSAQQKLRECETVYIQFSAYCVEYAHDHCCSHQSIIIITSTLEFMC